MQKVITPVHRKTRQRQVILEELCRLTSHPTAADLYEIVRRRLPNISLGTVYRNLDLLARMGTIHKIELSGAEARFDGDTRPHDHLRCTRCGRVDDVSGPPLDLAAHRPHDFAGYEVRGYRLEFLGVCPDCQGQSHQRQDPTETNQC